MGRELKRVSLDFNYPLGKVWEGYLVEWEDRVEPPTGEGYQMWETTSEGSPRTPVFETLDELCEWCAENETIFAHMKISKEEWRKVLDTGYYEHGNIIIM